MLIHRTIITKEEEFQNLTLALMEMERLGLENSHLYAVMVDMWEARSKWKWRIKQQ